MSSALWVLIAPLGPSSNPHTSCYGTYTGLQPFLFDQSHFLSPVIEQEVLHCKAQSPTFAHYILLQSVLAQVHGKVLALVLYPSGGI